MSTMHQQALAARARYHTAFASWLELGAPADQIPTLVEGFVSFAAAMQYVDFDALSWFVPELKREWQILSHLRSSAREIGRS